MALKTIESQCEQCLRDASPGIVQYVTEHKHHKKEKYDTLGHNLPLQTEKVSTSCSCHDT